MSSHKLGTIGFAIFLAMVLVATFAPLIAPHNPLTQNLGSNFLPPAWEDGGNTTYLLGTDALGRDLLSRLIFGARYSMAISISSVIIGSLLGFTLGILAGYFGGRLDMVLMRIGDIQLAFPFVLFAIAVLAVSIERTVWQITLVLGLTSWVLYARVVRSRVLSEREKEYATAARALGASRVRVLFRYILPNVWQVMVPIALLNLGFFVIVESLLSFLALGISPPTPSWGSMIADGRQFMMNAPWMALLPGLAIIVTVLGISLASDGYADVIDPKIAHGGYRRVPLPPKNEAPAPPDQDVLIRVRGLEVEYPSRKRHVHALRGVSFTLRRGEVLGVVGESGSGKSTLGLSIIQLLDSPGRVTAGEIVFDGIDLARLPNDSISRLRGRRIGMIFQDPANSLTPVLTVGYQLREVIRTHLGDRLVDLDRVAGEALSAVQIADPHRVLRSYPFQLSGGMQQRVMIALAMIANPDLLILDEPTSALDVTTQAQFLDTLEKVRSTHGLSVLFITHDLALLSDFADRVLVLYGGEVCEVAPMAAIATGGQHPYTQALLNAVARTGSSEDSRLRAIPGDPPDPTIRIPGCPFAPRCPHVMDICWLDKPALVVTGPDHLVACHRVHGAVEVVK